VRRKNGVARALSWWCVCRVLLLYFVGYSLHTHTHKYVECKTVFERKTVNPHLKTVHLFAFCS
jgi:hypothetical protein